MSASLVISDQASYLVGVREIRELAERIERIEDAKDLADRAAAAKVWAERARLGQDQVNLAAVAKLWAERRAGELLAAMPMNGGDRRSGSFSESPSLSLKDMGVSHNQSSEWQRMAAIPAGEFQAAVDEASSDGVVSRARVMAVHYSSATPEWATPQDIFDALHAEFAFTLDVCASAENAKCSAYFTEADDGLAQEWTGVCWMNPPYGESIGQWVRKARESAEAGATVVCLVPARVETGWWWDNCWQGQVRFIRGRLKFGGGETGAPFPSALVIFGREPNIPVSALWQRP